MNACRQKAAQKDRWAGVVMKPVSQTGLVSNGFINPPKLITKNNNIINDFRNRD